MDHHLADALSRATFAVVQESVDYDAMAACQKDDPEITAYRTAISGLQLEDFSFGAQDSTLLCDVCTGHSRPIVPADGDVKFLITSMASRIPLCVPQESSWWQSSSGNDYRSRWYLG